MKNASVAVLILAVGLAAGCAGLRGASDPDGDSIHPKLRRAQRLYESGRITDAMIACIDLEREDPDMHGLSDLQNNVARAAQKRRKENAMIRDQSSVPRMLTDIDEHKRIPLTYAMRRHVRGETSPLRTPANTMEQVLQKRINVHLAEVDLNAFVLAIGASENVNIIVDGQLAGSGNTMTLHADDTPLIEILNYASRNLDVTFSVGANIIWATPGQGDEAAVPLETRVYRLRKGISGEEVAGAEDGIDLVRAIERFIPSANGSDLLFNKKAHVLIAKNTRENLARIEDIIAALDVTPPQILIEARFVSTGVKDLSELGIDWFLDSAVGVTKTAVWENGQKRTANETQIDPGVPVNLTDFENRSLGLNLSYSGLLTDPMFRATLHALETSGKARTLSVPRVTTVNNREASIRIGEDFRYFEEYDIESSPSTTDDGQTIYRTTLVPVGSPQLQELGIELQVTPSVGADLSSIRLHILPKITNFVRFEFYETGRSDNRTGNDTNGSGGTNVASLIKLPIFETSELETEVVVHSGETVVMGGLITTKENKSVSRVPILSSLPLIGRLFRHDVLEEEKQNLLIFVTANIISETGENLIPLTDEMLEAAEAEEAAPGAVMGPAAAADANTPEDAR